MNGVKPPVTAHPLFPFSSLTWGALVNIELLGSVYLHPPTLNGAIKGHL